jgi:hypothetical protein
MCSRLKLILPDTIALDLGISNFVQRQAGRIRSENLQLSFLKRKQNKKYFLKITKQIGLVLSQQCRFS